MIDCSIFSGGAGRGERGSDVSFVCTLQTLAGSRATA